METFGDLYLDRDGNISPETIKDPGRDRFVMIRAFCQGIYAVLAEKGFDKEELIGCSVNLGPRISDIE